MGGGGGGGRTGERKRGEKKRVRERERAMLLHDSAYTCFAFIVKYGNTHQLVSESISNNLSTVHSMGAHDSM